jgi:hypothetical protein
VNVLPIAAQMPFSMYIPLVLLLVACAALSFLAGRARSNDDREQAERFANYGFLVVLVSAAYTLVLLIATAVGYPSRVYDMLIIIVVVAAFFALLLFVFFLLAEFIPRGLRRGGRR